MEPMASKAYFDGVRELLTTAYESQSPAISAAAKRLVQAVEDRKTLFVFGATHSAIMVAEATYRAGGLAVMNPILAPGMWLDQRPVTLTSRLENVPGFAAALLDEVRVDAGDVLIVASTSGRNVVPVEMALEGKLRGLSVIGITSVAYSSAQPSRHPSGKRLAEVADIVLDNLAPVGDALVDLSESGPRVGPVSTIIGVFLLNAVVVETASMLAARGMVPPVLMSANLQGGTEHNARVMELFQDRIRYL